MIVGRSSTRDTPRATDDMPIVQVTDHHAGDDFLGETVALTNHDDDIRHRGPEIRHSKLAHQRIVLDCRRFLPLAASNSDWHCDCLF